MNPSFPLIPSKKFITPGTLELLWLQELWYSMIVYLRIIRKALQHSERLY